MAKEKQRSILADQDRLFVLLQGASDTSQLDPARRSEVSGLIARIDAAIADTGDDRLICTREARTGSNYMVRVCRTPAQIRERAAASQQLRKEERGRLNCNDKAGCF